MERLCSTCPAKADNERLRALVEDACKVFDHYDLPEHAFHYRRVLARAHEQGGSHVMPGIDEKVDDYGQ